MYICLIVFATCSSFSKPLLFFCTFDILSCLDMGRLLPVSCHLFPEVLRFSTLLDEIFTRHQFKLFLIF